MGCNVTVAGYIVGLMGLINTHVTSLYRNDFLYMYVNTFFHLEHLKQLFIKLKLVGDYQF